MKMILLITNKDDLTTDFIVNTLNRKKIKYYRFNTEDFPLKIELNIDVKKKIYKLVDLKKGIELDLKEIKSVYFRRPKLSEVLNGFSTKGEKDFMLGEINYSLEGFYKLLSDYFWINPIFPIREAENKIYQLVLARSIGFDIPSTGITNSKDFAENFIGKESKEYVVKPIKTGFVNDRKKPKVIFTSLLTDKQIDSFERIKICPILMQERIEKKADIRVTVVGEKVFPALIESQKHKETAVDWRKNEDIFLEHKRFKLPNIIEMKCIELTKRLNLFFSAIDLVLDKNGNLIFLEINPNGQWAWIEKKLNYNISEEIVDLLIKG